MQKRSSRRKNVLFLNLMTAGNSAQPFGVEHAFFIGALVSVRTEVVALRLDQVRRQHRRTVAVIVGDGSGEGWRRDTVLYRIGNHITQRLLVFVGDLLEVRRQQQVGDVGIFCVGIGDLLQELRTNDAAGAEDLGDFAVVQIPVIFFGRRFQL
ncbi:Uncharacterised protein [Serratia odorifera]|uniref:Uncharacterized protein n=1 Tax=Serratia odorifera TaxID=618 RepID=A0A3S4FVX3_SEROD|nr:Uncharacterised protein [Serratia odorifera]